MHNSRQQSAVLLLPCTTPAVSCSYPVIYKYQAASAVVANLSCTTQGSSQLFICCHAQDKAAVSCSSPSMHAPRAAVNCSSSAMHAPQAAVSCSLLPRTTPGSSQLFSPSTHNPRQQSTVLSFHAQHQATVRCSLLPRTTPGSSQLYSPSAHNTRQQLVVPLVRAGG
jgi:hypothetical protein